MSLFVSKGNITEALPLCGHRVIPTPKRRLTQNQPAKSPIAVPHQVRAVPTYHKPHQIHTGLDLHALDHSPTIHPQDLLVAEVLVGVTQHLGLNERSQIFRQ